MAWDQLVEHGQYEGVKAAAHLALGLLAATAAVYNAAAFRARGETTNALNAALYGALVGLEAVKVAHHLGATDQEARTRRIGY
jgi:hypothetical protein